jgi:hypothetical protein
MAGYTFCKLRVNACVMSDHCDRYSQRDALTERMGRSFITSSVSFMVASQSLAAST